MRDRIKEEETEAIIAECVKNSELTCGEISEKYNISTNLGFYIITEASKKLKDK